MEHPVSPVGSRGDRRVPQAPVPQGSCSTVAEEVVDVQQQDENGSMPKEQILEMIFKFMGLKPPHVVRAATAFSMFNSWKHSSRRLPERAQPSELADTIVACLRKHGRASWHATAPPSAA